MFWGYMIVKHVKSSFKVESDVPLGKKVNTGQFSMNNNPTPLR